MAPKPIGLADPRVDICSDRGNCYYEHDHPVTRGNTKIIPQDAGPDVFDIIREELERNMVEKGSKFYIPRGTLREIVTPGRLLAVVQQLWASLPEDAQQQLCTRILYEVPCWKVFLLFIVTMQERLLPKIWKDENNKPHSQRLSDACLPLATFDARALKCRDAEHTHPTIKLGLSTRQAMVSWSYAINAVYFKLPTESRTNHVHYSLGPRDVLPYTATLSRPRESASRSRSLSNGRAGPSRQLSQTGKQKPDTNQDENLNGGFGEVKRVVIDRSHFDFGHLGYTKELTFALKSLHASDKDAFNKELASLVTFKSEKAIHLIKLLTTFSVIEEDGESEVFYLLFPWAEGNLWNYWERYQPKNEQERLALARWMAQQCYELAFALLCVHNERRYTLRYYQDLPAGKDGLYGRHGDIKAENVLYFQADDSLVLSNFGLGRLHTKYSRSNADPKALEKSRTYRAPEFDLAKGRISRASDVFSLGCMFLEFVTWHVMGYNAVYDEFPEYRMEEDVTYGFESDIFFKIEGDTAMIKPKVREWMDDLKNHKKASEYTKQFLGIIEDMLSPYPQDRIGVAQLVKELENISRTCEVDPSFYGGEARWEEAEKLEVQVMETSKAKLGANHPDTLKSMANVAFTWNNQGRHEDALALMQGHIEAEAQERHPGDLDSDESVSSSDNDSVFSILSSLSSTSSLGSVTDIKVLLAQNFATLLSEDEALISLISAAKFRKRIGLERMRENFRKLLKYFALDLKAEISSDQHRAVVGFVSSYSDNITRELFSTPSIIMDEAQILFPRSITKAYNTKDSRKKVEEYLSKEFAPDKPAKLVESVESAKPNNQRHLNNLNEFTEPNEDSDQDSVDDGAGEEPYDGSLEHLDQMKCFILESLAYQALRRRLHEFVYPSLRSRLQDLIAVWSKDDHIYHTYVTLYELSNLVAELQYIDPHEILFYDGEEERGYVSKAINHFQNAIEHWTGEHWDWWPLAPYLRPLEGGETRIFWECTCGEKRWAEVPLPLTKRLKSIIRKLPRSSIPLIPLQNPQSRPTSHPPTSSDQGAQRNKQTPGQSTGKNHRDQPPGSQPKIAGGNGATVIGIGQPDRRVLFIVSQGTDYKLAQIYVTGLHDCQTFFGTLKENYFRLRGQLRSWFSIWRYSHCDFYKCEKFDDHEFAPRQKDSFPDAVNPDYEYQPKPIDSIPPVSKHEFQKRFYACHETQGIHHRYHKCRILGHQSHGLLGYLPKKITELEEGGDKREVFWGIYAREIISLRWVLCYNFVCIFPMLVFFVCWVSPLGQNTDLQNPSVPISIMLSMLSLFWSIFLSSLQFGRSK